MQSKLLLIFFLGSFISFSQLPVWPTSDAEWYYTHGNGWDSKGCSHYRIDRDTIIDAKTYQIYSRQLDWVLDIGPMVYSGSDYDDKFFIIGVEDSLISYYDETSGLIDTLMNFKAQVGDKWLNPIHKENCNNNGEFITTEVIAISTEQISGMNLLKYRLHRYSEVFLYSVDYEEDFYQLIGSMGSSFVPEIPCSATDVPVDGLLRCFNYHLGDPDEFTYKTWLGECDYVEGLGLEEAQKSEVRVYYKGRNITVNGIALELSTSLRLFNSIGSDLPFKMLHQDINEWALEVDEEASGLIFLQMSHQGQMLNFKVMAY